MWIQIRDSESFHLGSGIREGKIRSRDKHPGSATLHITWCPFWHMARTLWMDSDLVDLEFLVWLDLVRNNLVETRAGLCSFYKSHIRL
jgi:hypothetical protein